MQEQPLPTIEKEGLIHVVQVKELSRHAVQLVGHKVQTFPKTAYPEVQDVHITVVVGLLHVTQFVMKKLQVLH